MNKKILVVLGNPSDKGLCGKLYNSYVHGAREGGHEVRAIKLCDLKFDPILHNGYREIQELEPDLKMTQRDITWADHLVFIFPVWWGGAPALLRGFFERIWLPGFAFKYRDNSPLWDRLLKGKSARLIVTMGAPAFLFRFFMLDAGVRVVKSGILKFCGVSPVSILRVGRAEKLSKEKIAEAMKKVEVIGKKGL